MQSSTYIPEVPDLPRIGSRGSPLALAQAHEVRARLLEAQWFGRGGVESAIGSSFNSYLTFMGPLTTGIGGPYAGFGSYAQGC